MGSIVMLSLYRCAENNKEFNGLQTVYFMMDYFDGASVEILDPQEVSLQECMGIKGNVNKIKEGISHQRFCLYTNKDEQLELWDPKTGGAHPILTIIQVFINPDVYQFRQFESGEPVSCDMCIKKVDAYIAIFYTLILPQ